MHSSCLWQRSCQVIACFSTGGHQSTMHHQFNWFSCWTMSASLWWLVNARLWDHLHFGWSEMNQLFKPSLLDLFGFKMDIRSSSYCRNVSVGERLWSVLLVIWGLSTLCCCKLAPWYSQTVSLSLIWLCQQSSQNKCSPSSDRLHHRPRVIHQQATSKWVFHCHCDECSVNLVSIAGLWVKHIIFSTFLVSV